MSFDGEVSEPLNILLNGNILIGKIANMATFRAAEITSLTASNAYNSDNQICTDGSSTTTSLFFDAQYGNVPMLMVWSSVVSTNDPSVYTTAATNVLTISTNDGRDENVKLCNGVGKCNFATGQCSCPFGYGYDGDYGPCGRVIANTSDFSGLARCPGVIDVNFDAKKTFKTDEGDRANYETRMYISMNPTNGYDYSTIRYYDWVNNPKEVDIVQSKGGFLCNLTSTTSAGPIVLDNARERLFLYDGGSVSKYIGIVNINEVNPSITNWLSVAYVIYDITMDAHMNSRKLYWTASGPLSDFTADGSIYYANMDDSSPTPISLVSAIGQANIIEPKGIAYHYIDKRIYWTDKRNSGGSQNSVLRSVKAADGSSYEETAVFTVIDSHVVSTDLTDLVIDFSHNNTCIMIDKTNKAIIAINLDAPIVYDDVTDDDQYEEYNTTRVIATNTNIAMTNPSYLAIDELNQHVLFSDTTLNKIGYARYKKLRFQDKFEYGEAFSGGAEKAVPVGMAFDRGLGSPIWGSYLDCYGNGRCLGYTGKFECQCNKGYYGDCQAAECPKGPAWFHEPTVDEIAHDVYMECSNMGSCDRLNGACDCYPGYEGNACERKSCPVESVDCNNRGQCFSLRNLAKHHKNEYLVSSPVEYGNTANNPNTWDADSIFGCVPDEYGYNVDETGAVYNISDYSGSSLDILQCPLGSNTRLADAKFATANYTERQEEQSIKCGAIQGSFRFEFRGKKTSLIAYDTRKADLQRILQATPTIGEVSVKYQHPTDELCSSTLAQTAEITFVSEMGRLPLLTVSSEDNTLYGNVVLVNRTKEGSTETLLQCSGYGFCNKHTGLCDCSNDRGTSDGVNNVGSRGDCGNSLIT